MITIFAGPTISDPEIKHVLPDARVLPPAAVGDIYAAAKSEPAGIGLIDGYFDGTPSVWHKEVLYALDAGIPVFGASSMGALRAAECHVFGMVGIGRIFEQCRDGLLDDDDEVAVIHGPAELGYVLLSEPMVNIRATLAVSVDAGVLSAAMASRLAELAKSILYPDRSWERLRDEAERLGIDPQALDRFDAWRATGYVDQKR
ncbi:MAG: TfuA-like protein, partial [Pseudomonadota bacterium]